MVFCESIDASQIEGDSKDENQELRQQELAETRLPEPPNGGSAAWVTLFGSCLVVFNTW